MSELAVPIIRDEKVLGVINIESDDLDAFTEDDAVVMEVLAEHVASALKRIQVTQESEGAKQQLITAQIRSEHERELNELKTRFMSTATHEIRTPLASIQGFTELIKELGWDDKEALDRFFSVILRNVNRLTVLTDDLLDLQRLEEGKITMDSKPVHIDDLLDDVRREFEPLLKEKNQTLRVINETDEAEVEIDQMRITQVFINLLSNASKFSPSGAEIELYASISNGFVKFDITDNGIGINEEDMEKLFVPFPGILVDGNTKGTGLGLSICKGLINLHGGTIYAESDGPGKGAKFTFTIPFEK